MLANCDPQTWIPQLFPRCAHLGCPPSKELNSHHTGCLGMEELLLRTPTAKAGRRSSQGPGLQQGNRKWGQENSQKLPHQPAWCTQWKINKETLPVSSKVAGEDRHLRALSDFHCWFPPPQQPASATKALKLRRHLSPGAFPPSALRHVHPLKVFTRHSPLTCLLLLS